MESDKYGLGVEVAPEPSIPGTNECCLTHIYIVWFPPAVFLPILRTLKKPKWVVEVRRPFGGPAHVLHYLARYTHRVAISNGRLIEMRDGQVTFRWRDSADKNTQKLLTVEAIEFIRRFLLHILPRGFVKIRHFGFLANCHRTHLRRKTF